MKLFALVWSMRRREGIIKGVGGANVCSPDRDNRFFGAEATGVGGPRCRRATATFRQRLRARGGWGGEAGWGGGVREELIIRKKIIKIRNIADQTR